MDENCYTHHSTACTENESWFHITLSLVSLNCREFVPEKKLSIIIYSTEKLPP